MTEKVDRILIRRYCHILDEKKARYVEEMPRENSFHSIMLGDALARSFRQEQWQDLIDHVSIHKFNFRKVEEALKNPHSYCAYMVAQRL